jgi:hypothetical protein
VIARTATPQIFSHNRFMQRVIDEPEYVLTALCQMRKRVSANPELFDPDAPGRIDEAIARTQAVLRSARREFMSEEQKPKAA